MIEITMKDFSNNFNDYAKRDDEILLIGYTDKTLVLKGRDYNFNEQYCIDNNIDIIETGHIGGVIVHFKDTIGIAHFKNEFNEFGEYFMNNFVSYLKSKNINAKRNGNDILIDNKYKVSSFSTINLNNGIKDKPRIYTAIIISLSVDLELIKHICKKEMVKIPKGLGEYGITTEEIVDLVTKLANEIN